MADSEIQEGQVFNRFLLLADMVGAMTTDESQCSCVCCTDQPAPETKSCIPDLVGSFHIGAKDMEKEGACDYRACHKCFPLTWPEDKKSVVKQDGVEFGNRRRQGTNIAKTETRNCSVSCEESAQFVTKLVNDGNAGFKARPAYCVDKHAVYRRNLDRCDKRMAEGCQTYELEQARTSISSSSSEGKAAGEPSLGGGPITYFEFWTPKMATLQYTATPFGHYTEEQELAITSTVEDAAPIGCRITIVAEDQQSFTCVANGRPDLGEAATRKQFKYGLLFIILKGEGPVDDILNKQDACDDCQAHGEEQGQHPQEEQEPQRPAGPTPHRCQGDPGHQRRYHRHQGR